MMVVDLPLSYFTSTLASALTGRPGTSFLVDGSGAILGPPGAAESLAARWRGPGELGAILRTRPDEPQVVDLADGGHGLLVRAVVGAHGWSVGVLAPLVEIEGPVRALTQSTLAYGSAGAVVLVLAVVLVARGASRRVRRLQAATAQLAEGHFGLRMPAEGTDEVADLGRSFNVMAESLARRDAELGARTEEAQRRRQELEVLNAVIQAAHTSLDLKESLEAILDGCWHSSTFRPEASGWSTRRATVLSSSRTGVCDLATRPIRCPFARGRGTAGDAPGRPPPGPQRSDAARSLSGARAREPGGWRRPPHSDPVQGRGAGRRRPRRATEAGSSPNPSCTFSLPLVLRWERPSRMHACSARLRRS